jgi:tRNA splicing ligase
MFSNIFKNRNSLSKISKNLFSERKPISTKDIPNLKSFLENSSTFQSHENEEVDLFFEQNNLSNLGKSILFNYDRGQEFLYKNIWLSNE